MPSAVRRGAATRAARRPDPEGRVAARHIGYGEDSFKQSVDQISQVIQAEVERLHAAPADKAAAAG